MDQHPFEAIAREVAENTRRRANGHAEPDAAAADAPWSEPTPLAADDAPKPFPIKALPPEVAAAVLEYQDYGGQPLPLIICSVLGAMSLAVQGLVDVRRDGRLVGPVSLNIAVIADSGERKTAVDLAFGRAADRYAESEYRRLAEPIHLTREARDAYEAEKAGLLAALKRASGKKKAEEAQADAKVIKEKLRELGKKVPPLPPIPTPKIEDITAEGIARVLRQQWPSSAAWSNEGGTIVGGHAFRDEVLVRSLAFLNSRWDGAAFDRVRVSEEYTRTAGRRLTVNLMLQPAAFRAFTAAGDGMARGLGALARFLLAWPLSTMGTRLRDPDEGDREMPKLDAFLERAEALHRLPLPMPFDLAAIQVKADEDGKLPPDPLELRPTELRLSPEARRAWIAYLNETELELAAEGEFSTVRDVAAKSAENACRLAAIFHVWRDGPKGTVGLEDMERGVAVARWFIYETRRILGAASEDEAAADAELLARWFKGWADKNGGSAPTLDEIARHAPYRLRTKARREAALARLIEHRWARCENRDGRTVVALNPGLARES